MSKHIPEERVKWFLSELSRHSGVAIDDVIITLADSLLSTAVECPECKRLMANAVPDAKWNQVFHGDAEAYLRHRAAHIICNYNDPPRGARINQLADEVAGMKAKCSRLQAALEEYGDHKTECAIYQRTLSQINACEWPPCTCGFDAALKETGKVTTEMCVWVKCIGFGFKPTCSPGRKIIHVISDMKARCCFCGLPVKYEETGKE